jgi:hypothetical protein
MIISLACKKLKTIVEHIFYSPKMKPALLLALPKKRKIIKRTDGTKMMFPYDNNPKIIQNILI